MRSVLGPGNAIFISSRSGVPSHDITSRARTSNKVTGRSFGETRTAEFEFIFKFCIWFHSIDFIVSHAEQSTSKSRSWANNKRVRGLRRGALLAESEVHAGTFTESIRHGASLAKAIWHSCSFAESIRDRPRTTVSTFTSRAMTCRVRRTLVCHISLRCFVVVDWKIVRIILVALAIVICESNML